MENQLDSVTEKPTCILRLQGLACDWSKHNKHSRNILGVHGFLRLSVTICVILTSRPDARIQAGLNSCGRSQGQNLISATAFSHENGHGTRGHLRRLAP